MQLKDKNQLKKEILQTAQWIEEALVYQLAEHVEELQNHAKLSAGYDDQTSNLKSSIGGVVLKNGIPVKYSGFSGTKEGTEKGNSFIESLIAKHKKGLVLILVAGMEYASYVENRHGLNVLKKTELKNNRELPFLTWSLKSKMKDKL